jgi:TolB-like protein/DNA-binding winged helix-turn-helix (wHTH) protein
MTRQPRQVYRFGPFTLVPRERQLLRDGQPVPLTAKCFDLLVALVENSGHLVTKDELMQRIWPDCFVEEANLSVNMSALRRALGEGANQAQYIETVPRHGYRFVAPVEDRWEEGPPCSLRDRPGEIPPAPDAPSAPPSLTPVPVPRPRARWPVALLALPLLAAGLLGLNAERLRERLPGAGTAARVQALAVLPLENLSGDASQEYFADGLTAELIADLSRMRALRVIARPSVMPYKRTRKAVPEIGRELNVDAVLTGSVLRSGEQVRVAVQLIDVSTDRSLWADSHERNLRDVLALQRAVTRDIVDKIRVRLSPQEQVRFGSVGPVNPEAYDQYLRGQYHLYRQNKEGNAAAIAALERAVAADPTSSR